MYKDDIHHQFQESIHYLIGPPTYCRYGDPYKKLVRKNHLKMNKSIENL